MRLDTLYFLVRVARAGVGISVAACLAFVLAPHRPAVAAELESPNTSETSYHYLGRVLDQKLSEMDWGNGARVGLLVRDSAHGVTILAKSSDQPMAPGSIMKLFTAAAALDQIEPDFRFSTDLIVRGDFSKKRSESGTLIGSILLRGTGDPTISTALCENPDDVYETFDRWAELLRQQKVKAIQGPVLVDDYTFDATAFPPGWPVEHLGIPRMPEVSALNFNDNCVELYWQSSKKVDTPAKYLALPDLPGFVFISNNVRVGLTKYPFREISRQDETNLINVLGTLPPETNLHERFSIMNSALFFGEALKARLIAKKIKVTGPVVYAPAHVGEGETNVAGATGDLVRSGTASFELRDTRQSPPLRELIQIMLRHDRNLDAEVLLKELGRRRSGEAGSFTEGTKAVSDFLKRQAFSTSGMVQLDGSGLSNLNRATPAQIMSFLTLLNRLPQGEFLRNSFPKSGEPGVLKSRFGARQEGLKLPPAEVSAITGSVRGGQSLTGWVKTRGGATVAFTIMVSGSGLTENELIQRLDSIVSEIARSPMQ